MEPRWRKTLRETNRREGAMARQTFHSIISPKRERSGFTLLELILALALSVILLALLGTAIQVYLRGSNSARESVEEAALARNLLQMIATDLRGTVRINSVDTSTVEQLAGVSGAASAASAAGGGGAGGTSTANEANEEDQNATADPPLQPGLIGDRYTLQVDVSRLPRIDQYQTGAEGELSQVAEAPSDIKTITYYVRGGNVSELVTTTSGATDNANGLARRSVDRAVSLWALENGGSDVLAAREDFLASEVTEMIFRYYDGTEWADEWDSELRGDLPVAVEITLAITMSNSSESGAPTSILEANRSNVPEPHRYRLLVRLPLAQPTSAEDALSESEVGSDR